MAENNRRKSLVGKIFEDLLVIGDGNDYISPSGQSSRTLIVECQCLSSSKFQVRYSHLLSGATTSCEFCRKNKIRKSKTKNLLGMVFGNLEVIDSGSGYTNSNGVHAVTWLVKCHCCRSHPFEVRAGALLRGKSTRCSVCAADRISETLVHDLSGKRFGKLLVRGRGERSSTGTKWKVSCDCSPDVVYSVFANNLIRGFTTSCGCGNESGIATKLKEYCRLVYNAIPEYKIIRNPKTNRFLSFDIYIPLGKFKNVDGVYIEINGDQHYRYVPGFHKSPQKFEDDQYRYSLKKKFATQNGRLLEIDLREAHSLPYLKNIIDLEVGCYV